jgi:phosphatidylglycerol:prolipoprotein diacylglycerol transferase
MMPVLHLGPLNIAAAPLSLLVAFFVLQDIGDRAAKRLQLPDGVVSGALLWALGVGIIAARLGYGLRYWDAYASDPLQIFALNVGTLDATIGVLGGILAALVYLQRKKIDVRAFGDAIAPGLALAFAVLSLGNLLSGDAYGAVAQNVPWAIALWGEQRHPVQAYEMLAYIGIFAWLWRRAPRPFAGATFLLAVAAFALVRLVFEPLRGDSALWVQGIRTAQVIALLILVGALFLYVRALPRAP